MSTKAFFLVLVSFLATNYCIGQADDSTISVPLTPSAGYCTFSAPIVTTGATASLPAAQFVGSADDDVWYKFVPWIGFTADPTIVSVIWVRFEGLAANDGNPGLVAELWHSGTGMVDYYFMENRTEDSIAFRNLIPGANYFLRIYTPGNTKRITGGNVCINQPCRNPRPGAQCQGGFGLGAEENNSCAFTTGYVLVPHFPEIGCLPVDILESNTLFTTGDEGKLPVQAGSADDDIWFDLETSNLNIHSILLSDVVAVEPGTEVQVEWWDATCNTRLPATQHQTVANAMRFDFITPQVQKNTRYKLRIYTVGKGAMKGLRSFKICYENSGLDNDGISGAISIPVSSGSCVFSPTGANLFSNLGALPSVLAVESPGNQEEKDDEVWFRFTTPSLPGQIRLTFDEVSWLYLEGYRGVKAEIWQAASNTFHSVETLLQAGSGSRMLFSGLTPGTEYLIRLYSASTNNRLSAYKLCLVAVPPPANNDCSGATAIAATEAPFTATCTPSLIASTEGATASAQPVTSAFEGSQDDDVWFSFTTTARNTVRIVVKDVITIGMPSGLVAELWTADCLNRIGEPLLKTAATQYSFVFSGLMPATQYRLRLYTPGLLGSSRVVSMGICVLLTPFAAPNDFPEDAIWVHFDHRSKTEALQVGRFATTGGSPSGFPAAPCIPALAPDAHNDVFFKFVPLASTLTLQLNEVVPVTGTAPGLAMEILKKDAFSGQFIALDGACAAGHTLHIDNKLIIGNEYLIRVFNRGAGNESAFTLAGFIPPGPGNDTCINAIEIPYIQDLPLGNPIPASSLHAYKGPPEIAASCLPAGGSANSDLWYKFRVLGAGKTTRIKIIDIERVNNVGDPAAVGSTSMLWVLYKGTCQALTRVACGSESDNFPDIVDGTLTYYLRVFNYDPQVQVKYKIYLEPVNYEWRNRNCENAITITPAAGGVGTPAVEDIAYNGFTEAGDSDANDCFMPYPTQGVWFKFRANNTTQNIYLEGLRATENTEFSYPDAGIRWYEGNTCGSLVERGCIASFSQQGGTITGLTVGNTYYIRVQKTMNSPHVKFKLGIGYGNPSPNNDEFTSPLIGFFAVPMEPFCGKRNIFRQRGATLTATPAPSAQATDAFVQGDTWIKFTATEQKGTLYFYDVFVGMGVELYGAIPTTPLTDYMVVPPHGKVPLPVSLVKGNEYFLRIYHSGSGHLDFRLCLIGNPPATDIVRGPASVCTPSDEGSVLFSNTKLWKHFTKEGKLIASIYDNQPLLGNVSLEYYLHPGPVRGTERGAPYLDRNFGINRTGSAIDEIQIIFYLTREELENLIAANPESGRRVSFLNDLGIWRIPGEACSGNISETDGFLYRAIRYGLLEGSTDVFYVQFRTTNFSGFYLGNFPESPLPVTCKSFKALSQRGKVYLEWLTSSEVNHKGFMLERSINGMDFQPITYITSQQGQVLASGKKYTFTDGTVKSGGRYFYRLKQEDLDGMTTSACGIQQVEVALNNKTTLYPNPVKDRVTIRGYYSSDKMMYEVIDNLGRLVNTGQVMITNGVGEINLANLPDGIYQLKLLGQDGKSEVLRLVKQGGH